MSDNDVRSLTDDASAATSSCAKDALAAAFRYMGTTITKATGEEEVDIDDDEPVARSWRTLLTTETAAATDNETDEEDVEQALLLRAMTTTLTESTGDNESDLEDDQGYFRKTCGTTKPLAFRFLEPADEPAPELIYDDARQLHIMPDGTPIIDVISKVFAHR